MGGWVNRQSHDVERHSVGAEACDLIHAGWYEFNYYYIHPTRDHGPKGGRLPAYTSHSSNQAAAAAAVSPNSILISPHINVHFLTRATPHPPSAIDTNHFLHIPKSSTCAPRPYLDQKRSHESYTASAQLLIFCAAPLHPLQAKAGSA